MRTTQETALYEPPCDRDDSLFGSLSSSEGERVPKAGEELAPGPDARHEAVEVTDRQRDEHKYGLRRGLGFWEVLFEGRRAVFKHEQGALYVACLLLDSPPEPIHAVALALRARKMNGQSPGDAEFIQERNLGLDDAEVVRRLRRKQRELETVLENELAIEPVKAEARREREQILEYLRKNSWRTRDNASRCVRAVAVAINRFHARLAKAVDREGRPHPVLRGFARHLREHLLIPSGRGRGHGGARASWSGAGCFTYESVPGVVWGPIADSQ